jgi:hypothetical protein
VLEARAGLPVLLALVLLGPIWTVLTFCSQYLMCS